MAIDCRVKGVLFLGEFMAASVVPFSGKVKAAGGAVVVAFLLPAYI
jgi:hypothetical protein